VVINPRRRRRQQTFLAIVGNNHFSLVPAFEGVFEAVQAQAAFGLLAAMAAHAGGLEEGKNILVKRDALLIRSWRKFADIDLANVPGVWRRILGRGRKTGQQQSERGQCDCRFHFHYGGTMANCPLDARKR
jgi:hypothetical protein